MVVEVVVVEVLAVNHRLYTFISVFPSKREGYDKMMFYCGGISRAHLHGGSDSSGFIYMWGVGGDFSFFRLSPKPARRTRTAEQGIKQCLLICSMGC